MHKCVVERVTLVASVLLLNRPSYVDPVFVVVTEVITYASVSNPRAPSLTTITAVANATTSLVLAATSTRLC